MKQKLFYLLPFLALAGCGEPSYKDASFIPPKEAANAIRD